MVVEPIDFDVRHLRHGFWVQGVGLYWAYVEENATLGIQEESKSTLVELLKFLDKITEMRMEITVEKPGGFILMYLEP